jgi:hypothetical protein
VQWLKQTLKVLRIWQQQWLKQILQPHKELPRLSWKPIQKRLLR